VLALGEWGLKVPRPPEPYTLSATSILIYLDEAGSIRTDPRTLNDLIDNPSTLPDAVAAGKAETHGVTFLMADSSIPGEDAGLLDDETIAWLDHELKKDDGPAFVCFHHPPVPLHLPLVDEIRQQQPDRLAALVERYPRVIALLCGHAYTAAATTFANRPLLVAPGTASTLKLPWEPGETLDRVAFHILDDGRLTTHFRLIT
jgi:3',5'-cyclic AMP phosphodiesterase CpdA